MDPFVLCLVLGAAVLHASWNALVKSGGDPWLRMGVVMGTSGLCGFALSPFVAFPEADVWPYLLASAAIHQVYFVSVCMGYRVGDLSHVYPIQRGIAPVLVALGAYLFMGENLSTQGLAGVGLISLAILSLAIHTTKFPEDIRPLGFALFTGVNIAVYSVIDGMASRVAEDVFSYIVWLMIIGDIPFGIVAIVLTKRRGWNAVKGHFGKGMLGGVFTFSAYALAIWAMSLAPVTYVSALRETSVVVAAWIGCKLLNEPFGGRRILAASTVAIGVIVLHTSGVA